jgi:hypothetical protein
LNDFDNFDSITCRLAIQVCIGRSPNGRARHRTFSIKDINPDADIALLERFFAAWMYFRHDPIRVVSRAA